MGNCQSCGHEYERHLFGGMCFYCDCKRAVYSTGAPVYLRPHEPEETQSANGSKPAKARKKKTPPRLGNK
jgi:hypothetical protein